MTTSMSNEWTTPERYMRGVAPVPQWRLIIARLSAGLDHIRLALRDRREARRLARFHMAAEHLPDYLRRDIGLPPYRSPWMSGVAEYR